MERQILSASTIIGEEVRNIEGDDLGNLEELMIDVETGCIAYAVLSFGGFLGIADKLFAVPWDALTINMSENAFILDVDKETIENAPGFDRNHWPDMSNKDWGKSIYSYYGFAPYWEHERF